jgi:plasmid stabilization system protein ParE
MADGLRRGRVPPYRIYYRVRGQELQVIRVYHQARRPIEL